MVKIKDKIYEPKYNKKYFRKLDKLVEEELKKEMKDRKYHFIPLTRDYAFKTVMFNNPIIFRNFLINVLKIKNLPKKSEIVYLDKELVKFNFKEKGKVADIVVKIGDNLIIDVEMNCQIYETVKRRNNTYMNKLQTLQIEVGDKYVVLESKFLYQLNLNGNPDEVGDIKPDEAQLMWKRKKLPFDDNKKIFAEYLVYYYKKYYNGDKLSDEEIFMAGLMSKSYTEIYSIMSKVLSLKELDEFMESVVNMGTLDGFVLHEWCKEKLDKMVEEDTKAYYEKRGREEGIKEGREEGIKENIITTIKNMLQNNYSYDDIVKITGKDINYIKNINNDLN